MNPTKTTVVHFEIPYFRYLDPQGVVEQALPKFAEESTLIIKLYRTMVLTRLFDKKAIALQRTGKLGTYPSILGQEAISTGLGAAMDQNDIFCPYYRDQAAMLWRNVKMEEILLYWGGDERGNNFQNNKLDFPICVPIASQTLHAAGAAFAIKYRHEKRAVVVMLGDGATSRGDFYESVNIAGVWDLPVVYVINNNQWAISVPRSAQSKAQTLAQKAIAAGVEGWQIDGNDVFAVKDAVDKALEKAKNGQGPTVIEALSYRMSDHTTADDASRYRISDELKQNEKYDPIMRLKNYMVATHLWDQQKEDNLQKELSKEVEEAVARFDNFSAPAPESMFDYLYETLPEIYQEQREKVKRGMDE